MAGAGDDTVGHRYVKVPVGDFLTMAQRAKGGAHPERKPAGPVIGRVVCWTLAGAFFLTAAIFTSLAWSHQINLPTGAISWLSFLSQLCFIGALTIQMTLNQQRIMKLAAETTALIRHEIRDARPVDAQVIAQLSGQLQANRVFMEQEIPRLIAEAVNKARAEDRAELEETVPRLIAQTARRAYADGLKDMMAAADAVTAERQRESAVPGQPVPDLAEDFTRYLTAREDFRREQGGG